MMCSHFKRVWNSHLAPMWNYPDITGPFGMIYLDLIGLIGMSDNKCMYVMTIIDVFTRYLGEVVAE